MPPELLLNKIMACIQLTLPIILLFYRTYHFKSVSTTFILQIVEDLINIVKHGRLPLLVPETQIMTNTELWRSLLEKWPGFILVIGTKRFVKFPRWMKKLKTDIMFRKLEKTNARKKSPVVAENGYIQYLVRLRSFSLINGISPCKQTACIHVYLGTFNII